MENFYVLKIYLFVKMVYLLWITIPALDAGSH